MDRYKVFSRFFSYPDEGFFQSFPELLEERDRILADYDLLFRERGIWLYTTEYVAEGAFQKPHCLADITGFYRAFGLQTHNNRPDSLSVELEFMHFLIFKRVYAMEKKMSDYPAKASLCLEAQKKFFHEHLFPGAMAIAERVASQEVESVYRDVFDEMSSFLVEERGYLKNK